MSVTKATITALTKLTPQVLKTPYYEFFDLFSGERPEEHEIDNKNNLSIKKIFDEYYIHCWDHCEHREWKNKKTKLKKIIGSLCAKLDGVFWDYSAVGISNINWAELDIFSAGMRDWKNVAEYKVRWAIFNKFNSLSDNNKIITVKDLETTLEGFEINVDRMIKKIFQKSWVNVDISYDGYKITINNKVNDPIITKYITDPMEWTTRSGPETNDVRILELLDEGAYTQKEMTKFLDLKKSAVSKICSRLGEEGGSNEIKFVNRGPRGSSYYTTNCENCFLGKEKKTCRKESIDEITTIIKESFGVEMPKDYFEQIKFNQGLLKLRRVLREAERLKDTRLDDNFNQVLGEMFQMLITQSNAKTVKKGDYAVSMDEILANLPVLFEMGWRLGNVSGASLLGGFYQNISQKAGLKPGMKITKKTVEKITKAAEEEVNRLSSLSQ